MNVGRCQVSVMLPKMKLQNVGLTDDLRNYLESVPPVTKADLEGLEKAAMELDSDPAFLADCLKGAFVEKMLELKELNESQNQLAAHRPSSEIEAQLDAFLASLPADITAPPANDFAAQLQWDAWQNHRRELEAELKLATEI